ncbi:hypothetical protein PC129_g3872 [Phytophthora cactorum]|uniref:Uncharacterized protein n=1 Tax=Phytophthora cactorum TaxID=29920 RepID=A0A8T1IRF4_9STRA|nr:hypothetical protein PC122_g5009 [Phytophthora cactorum]KAG3225512.1 hypothetical protein PC129_g3872 [Phytophthora cactorum]
MGGIGVLRRRIPGRLAISIALIGGSSLRGGNVSAGIGEHLPPWAKQKPPLRAVVVQPSKTQRFPPP